MNGLAAIPSPVNEFFYEKRRLQPSIFISSFAAFSLFDVEALSIVRGMICNAECLVDSITGSIEAILDFGFREC